jgi:GNAT superfamily N-acetyltransferase
VRGYRASVRHSNRRRRRGARPKRRSESSAANVSAVGRIADLLAAYDEQLRTDAETPSAVAVARLGPLRLVTFAGGRGFVTYRDLGRADVQTIQHWVREAVTHYRQDPSINRVEWKTRGHDHAPGLHDALLDNGFTPDETESIMIGEARTLAAEVPVPAGVRLRRVTAEADVRAMCAMEGAVFDDPHSDEVADALLRRLTLDDGMELWVAESQGRIVGAGRLEPVRESQFAGIWGGATRPEWRGQGIYRALTAARARSALEAGKTLIHSDSTEYSRPILERSGMVRVSTTTPYRWRR